MRTSRWVRWAGILLVIVALAALVWAHRGELPATWHALRGADRGWLVIGIAAVVLFWLGYCAAGPWRCCRRWVWRSRSICSVW